MELSMDTGAKMLEAALWGFGAIYAPLWLIHKFIEGRPSRNETRAQKEVQRRQRELEDGVKVKMMESKNPTTRSN